MVKTVAALVQTAGLQCNTNQASQPQDTHTRKRGDLFTAGSLFCNASLAMDVTITHPFTGNSADPATWGTYQPGVLAARANAKQHKHWYHALYSISFLPFVTMVC